MKTTLELDPDLLNAVRARAAERRTTMRAVIEDALRRALSEGNEPAYTATLPVTDGQRQPWVDIDSNAAIDAFLDRRQAEPDPA